MVANMSRVIQIRDVPDDVHDALADAAEASMTTVASDLVLLGAPPGFRTQNLRIKSLFKAVSDGS